MTPTRRFAARLAPALTLLALPALGQPAGERLDLLEAARRALASHPSVGAADAALAAAAARRDEARSARRPDLAASGAVVRHGEAVPVTPIHGFGPGEIPEFDDTLVQGSLSLRHELWDGGARAARLAGQEAAVAAAGESLAGSRQALLARTLGAYLRLAALDEMLEAHRARTRALGAEVERAERLLAAGGLAAVDLRRVEAALASARADEVAVAADLAAGERELARLIGLDGVALEASRLVPVRLPAADPAASRELLVAAAAAALPAVREAEREIARARAAVALARSGARPRVRAEANLQELGGAGSDFAGEWNAALRVAVPLFDGGVVAARVAEAEALARLAEERLRLARDQAAAAVDGALADLERAAAREEALLVAVAGHEEVVRVEALRLETGVGVHADWLAAQADLLAARAGLAEARLQRAVARGELARATGGLDLDWLARSFEEVDR